MGGKPRVAVFGSGTLVLGTAGFDLGVRLGAALARAGATVVTGGYRGAMEAVSRGAVEAGGEAIGVTVDLYESRGPANTFLTERVHTKDLHERLRWLITNCEAFVVLPGSIGTLTELFLTWTLVSAGGRPPAPLVLLGDGWREIMTRLREPGWIPDDIARDISYANDPEDAARLALAHVGSTLKP